MPCAAIHSLSKAAGINILEAISSDVLGPGDRVQDPGWVVPGDFVNLGREQALAEGAWRRGQHSLG